MTLQADTSIQEQPGRQLLGLIPQSSKRCVDTVKTQAIHYPFRYITPGTL